MVKVLGTKVRVSTAIKLDIKQQSARMLAKQTNVNSVGVQMLFVFSAVYIEVDMF